MPRGQSPKQRMNARRSRLGMEEAMLSGADLPYPTFGDDDKPSLMDRGVARGIREMTQMRRNQLEGMNREGLARRRDQINQIDMNRENEAERSMRARGAMKFGDGGEVRGCKGNQMSGKKFSGTF